MSDFTLDYFFTQLLRYLEKNKDLLEATPKGAYAVNNGEGENTEPGVIFVLWQKDTDKDRREKVASPIQPYYIVYVRTNGDIHYSCTNARQILELFEAVAVGKFEPLQDLCDRFDRETQHGKDMTGYETLLNNAMKHINVANSAVQTAGLRAGSDRNIKIPPKSNNSARNFELVTWLIIFGKEACA